MSITINILSLEIAFKMMTDMDHKELYSTVAIQQ